MIDLIALKHTHMALAGLSVLLFILRFAGREAGLGLMRAKAVRIAPHLVDTLLLLSGLTLMVMYRLSPLEAQWLGVKLLVIVGYVLAGVGAMKATRQSARFGLAALALALVAGVFHLALQKPF